MFVGHYAIGLAAKKFAPRTSLGLLIAAPILLDLIWPIFDLLGTRFDRAKQQSFSSPAVRFVSNFTRLGGSGWLGHVVRVDLFWIYALRRGSDCDLDRGRQSLGARLDCACA